VVGHVYDGHESSVTGLAGTTTPTARQARRRVQKQKGEEKGKFKGAISETKRIV
jgi:hypothetical protein